MSTRSLDLLDLPTLYHLRGEAISLDSTRALTRGNPLGAIGLLAYMHPQRHIYSVISTENGIELLGGIIHTNGDDFARLLYLAPASRIDHPALPALIDKLNAEAGAWGAFHVLAELDESDPAFTVLRRAGFSVYAGQRMWDVSAVKAPAAGRPWSPMRSIDLPLIQSLYHQIVPALLQPVEPAPKRAIGFICNESGTCYATTSSGLSGIVIFPLIHPDSRDVAARLAALIHHLPNRGGRSVYVCLRTYQAWLEHALEDLGAKPGPQQAILVKHLARHVKEEQAVRAAQPARVSMQATRVSRFEEKKKGI